MGLTYKQKIHEKVSGDLIHEEDGQWLWNMKPGVGPPWTATRIGVIPHGVVVSAPGDVTAVTGDEMLAEQEKMSQLEEYNIEAKNMGNKSSIGYFEGKFSAGCPCDNGSPVCM